MIKKVAVFIVLSFLSFSCAKVLPARRWCSVNNATFSTANPVKLPFTPHEGRWQNTHCSRPLRRGKKSSYCSNYSQISAENPLRELWRTLWNARCTLRKPWRCIAFLANFPFAADVCRIFGNFYQRYEYKMQFEKGKLFLKNSYFQF